MKAILEFNLPEESDEHQCAVDGMRWRSAMHALDRKLREIEKHSDAELIAGRVREMLYEAMEDSGVSFGK